MGLGTILLSKKQNRILIGNNTQCAVDELSISGEFIQRRYLWEIAPDIFIKPARPKAGFTYGLIRQLCELPNGSIYMIVANCNATNSGKVLDFESGNCVLDGLYDPNGALSCNDFFIIQDGGAEQNTAPLHNRLVAYAPDPAKRDGFTKPAWNANVQHPDSQQNSSDLHLQGFLAIDDTIYCGVNVITHSEQRKWSNFIVSLDSTTGRQLDSFKLPELPDFQYPEVIAISRLPEKWSIEPRGNTVQYIVNGKQLKVMDYKNPEKNQDPSSKQQKQKQASQENQLNTKIQENQRSAVGPRSVLIDNVSLCYRRTGEFLFSFRKKQRTEKKFWALKNVSTSFFERETIGLIGRNGSGKSTLSMMISGALKPDKGKIITNGKVQLLALGIGFRPQLTGRENVMISGAILGMSRKDIKAKLQDIEEFAELGDFFDEPIRTYSAGMKSRLGFAVSTAVEPDILILDEVMSTGDAAFRKKANKRMEQMRAKTKTVIVVSHNPGQIKELCTRVIWLEKGRLIMDGTTEKILPIYEKFCQNPKKWLNDHPDTVALFSNE